MNISITEVQVRLADAPNDRLRAYCTIVIGGGFAVRDVKVVEGKSGELFVSMPSRRIMAKCRYCRFKNSIQARFCNDCGKRLPKTDPDIDLRGKPKVYADVAHPIHPGARQLVEDAVLKAYEEARKGNGGSTHLVTSDGGE